MSDFISLSDDNYTVFLSYLEVFLRESLDLQDEEGAIKHLDRAKVPTFSVCLLVCFH